MGSNPTRAAIFFSSEKKELFGLVAFPFFLLIEKSFHVNEAFLAKITIIINKIVFRVAVNTYVPIFRGLDARGGRKLRTDTRDNLINPRCACAQRGL